MRNTCASRRNGQGTVRCSGSARADTGPSAPGYAAAYADRVQSGSTAGTDVTAAQSRARSTAALGSCAIQTGLLKQRENTHYCRCLHCGIHTADYRRNHRSLYRRQNNRRLKRLPGRLHLRRRKQ